MKICDCTLRDGGYYTNWDFKKELVVKYLKTMETIAAIDVVELGYRSVPMDTYYGQYFYCPEYFLKEAKLIAPSKTLAIMLNEKSVSEKDLDYLLNPCVGIISIIRLAVNPDSLDKALELAKLIKKRNFQVSFNIMYMSKWANDDAFLTNLTKAEGLVDYIYLVDSYGSVLPEEVSATFLKVSKVLNTALGFHGHNNLELGLINSVKAMDAGAEIIDSTITGMGRGAGNLKTELLLTYLNAKNGLEINFSNISDLILDFEDLQRNFKWGTNLPYMISGAFSLPQAEVMNWMGKHRYTVNSIVTALQHKKDDLVDNLNLEKFVSGINYDEAIIIGGGKTALEIIEAIDTYLSIGVERKCIIFAGGRYAGAYSFLNATQFYCLVGAEAHKYESSLQGKTFKGTCIFAPSPRIMGTILPKSSFMAFELEKITFFDKYFDSLLVISLQLSLSLGVKTVSLVGFDGYDLKVDDALLDVANENQVIIESFGKVDLNFRSFTPTRYDHIKQDSIYCYL